MLEDSDITPEELLAEGIPAEVVEAIPYLSKTEGEEYQEFVARAKRNKIAAKVKIADIEANIDVLRLSSLDEWDFAPIKKYHSAWRLLQEGLPQVIHIWQVEKFSEVDRNKSIENMVKLCERQQREG